MDVDSTLHAKRMAKFQGGMTARDIARDEGVHLTAVYVSLRKCGFSDASQARIDQRLAMRKRGLTVRDIAHAQGVLPATVRISFRKMGFCSERETRTQIKLDAYCRLMRAGMSVREVAEIHKTTPGAVRFYLHYHLPADEYAALFTTHTAPGDQEG